MSVTHPISYCVANDLLSYDPLTGALSWKSRCEKYCAPLRVSTWNTRYADREISAIDSKGYLFASIFGKQYRAHRLAWFIHYGEWPNVIDHVNGVRTDNRIINLRSVTVQQNHMNSKLNSKNTSGVCGVYFNNRRNLWCAQMKFQGVTYHLGSSKNLFDAVCMRKSEERKLGFSIRHGEK